MKAKEKEKLVSSQNVLESTRIAALIRETHTLIAAKQADLLQIPADHQTLLGAADAVDVPRVVALKQQQVTLDLDLEDLSQRVRLLETQKWEAEKVEAADRVREIVTECEQLVRAATTARALVADCEQALINAVHGLVLLHVEHLRLRRECTWLAASYRLPRSELPRLVEFDPAPEVQRKMGEVFEILHQARLQLPPKRKQKPDDGGVFAEG
jgi:DNA-directed RNA polymerase subunit H (RpoH/RPB5)